MGDMAEDFRAMRDHQRQYKQKNRSKFMEVIDDLKKDHAVTELTPYQYRVDNMLDIYPSNKKWHLLPTGERGHFKTARQLVKLLNQTNN